MNIEMPWNRRKRLEEEARLKRVEQQRAVGRSYSTQSSASPDDDAYTFTEIVSPFNLAAPIHESRYERENYEHRHDTYKYDDSGGYSNVESSSSSSPDTSSGTTSE